MSDGETKRALSILVPWTSKIQWNGGITSSEFTPSSDCPKIGDSPFWICWIELIFKITHDLSFSWIELSKMIPYLEDSIIYDSLLLHGTALLLTTIVSYCLSFWVTNTGLNLQIWLSFFYCDFFLFHIRSFSHSHWASLAKIIKMYVTWTLHKMQSNGCEMAWV